MRFRDSLRLSLQLFDGLKIDVLRFLRLSGQGLDRLKIHVLRFPQTVWTSFRRTKNLRFEIPSECPYKFLTDLKLLFWHNFRLSRQVLDRLKIVVWRFPQTFHTSFGGTKNLCFEIPSDCPDGGQVLDWPKIYNWWSFCTV